MDCFFFGHCHSRPQPCYQLRPQSSQNSCPRPCPPDGNHLRPPAGVGNSRGKSEETHWKDNALPDWQRPSQPSVPSRPRHCMGQVAMDWMEVPYTYFVPVPYCQDSLRFSRHVVEDCRSSERKVAPRVPRRPVQVGTRPLQMLREDDYDPCPQKKGPDCDCFNPDGSWKEKSKAPMTDGPTKALGLPLSTLRMEYADYDPCPNKKGADCDCFNPDGTWRDKSKDKVAPALPKPDSRSKTYQNCSDDCPECPIEIHSRTVYPKCEAMLPGYGGHVPGIQVCKFGKTFGRETREALQKVYSTPLLRRHRKSC